MNYQERINIYSKISEIRNRPLIAYVTSLRENAIGVIGGDVIPHILKQISEIPENVNDIDLLIISNGGDPTVSYRIVNLLRERFDNFGVLLPYTAYSAATLISLGADEIVMHPYANLGPVDPQLSYRTGDKTIRFGSEDLRNFLSFVKEEVGISDQAQLQKSFEIVCKEVGSIPIGIARRGSRLALSMGQKLLALHTNDSNETKTIAETLNKSFDHHGYPLGPSEAKEIGLKVIKAEGELKDCLHAIHISFEDEMKFNSPFLPLQVVLNDPTTAPLLGPTPQVQIPANLDPNTLQQVYQKVLGQIRTVEVPAVDYKLFTSAVESVYCRSHCHFSGKILSNRLPDNSISFNVVQIQSGWGFENNENKEREVEFTDPEDCV